MNARPAIHTAIVLFISSGLSLAAPLYREAFNNPGTSDIELGAAGWQLSSSAGYGRISSTNGIAQSLTRPNLGQSDTADAAIRGYAYATQTTSVLFHTDEYNGGTILNVANVGSVTFYQGNSEAGVNFHVAVEIGGQWYASRPFTGPNVGAGGNFTSQSVRCVLNDFKSADWSLLVASGAGHSLGAGGLTLPSGNFVRFGVFVTKPTSASFARFDNFEIATTPAWQAADPPGPDFSEEQKTAQRTAGAALLTSLRNAAANYQPEFTMPPGDYRFNAGTGQYPILKNIRNMVINATDVTFWFDAPHTWGLQFEDCKDVRIRGLTMDCDPHPHTQGMITTLNRSNNTVELTVMDGFRMPSEGETRATICYRPDGSFIMRGHNTGTVNLLGGRSIRVTVGNLQDVNVGDYMVLSQRTGQFLRVVNCAGMLFEDVNLWAGGGMAVLESGGAGGNIYRRVKATRRPGTNRLHAFGADGFHMTDTEKGPVIDSVEVSHTSDDLVNIHGKFGQVASRTNARTLRIMGTSSPFYIGQKLDFWGEYSLKPQGSARIVTLSQVTDSAAIEAAKQGIVSSGFSPDVYDVTLDADVEAVAMDLIEHHNKVCADFVVKNSYFHDCFNRAFLLNGSPGGLVSGNTFENIHSGGLNVAMETWNYMEGQFAHGSIIENNVLRNMPGISVSLNPRGPAGPHRYRPVRDITVRNNYVEGPIKVMHVDTARILDNTVVIRNIPANWSRPVISEDFYGSSFGDAIQLSVVAHANIAGNTVTWNNPGGDDVRIGPLTENIRIDGEQQWEAIADFNTGWFINGLQNDFGWSYGTADGAAVRNGNYQTGLFQQFPIYDGKWRDSAGGIPYSGKYDIHPSPTRAVVRRWIPQQDAMMRAQGRVQAANTSGNQTVAYIFVGGVLKWSQNTSGSQVYSFDADLGMVSAGTPVDIVVDSKGNSDFDETSMSLMIVRPPVAASVPAVPSGLNGSTTDWKTLDLAWDRTSATESYTLKRASVSGGPYVTIASGLVQPGFTDETVVSGNEYYYVVSAVNWIGASADSAEFRWSGGPGAEILKADNPDAMLLGSSWIGGVAPGPFDVAVWNNSTMSSGARAAGLGANLSWSGMRVIAAGGSTSIPSGNALTVGPAGIRVQNSNDLNLHTIVVGADQTWTLGTSRAISVSAALRGENVVLNVAGQSSSYMNITGSAADFSGTFNYGAGARLRLRAAFQATRLDLNVTSSASVSAEGTIGTVRIGNLRTANTAASLGNTDQNGAVTYEIGHLGMDGTWAGLIRNGASDHSRVTTIHKLGGGSWTLTRANTYTGNTTVGGGALMVANTSGSATGSGSVAVKEGAMLGGTGIITGPLTIESGGVLSPGPGGNGTGVLQVGNTVALAGETRIAVNRANSPNASRLSGITSLTLGGSLVLTNIGQPLQAGDTFSLFSAGDVSGSFTSLQLPQLDSGLAWETGSLHLSGSISVVSTRTPFMDWQNATFNAEQLADPAVSGPDADPNRDGVVNKLEFFLNRDPLGPNALSTLPRIALTDGHLEYWYTRRIAAANEMIHAVEWSDDLAGVPWSGSGVTETIINEDAEVQQVKATVPMSPNGKRFVRLKVE